MRISDWSSDVCSSDLKGRVFITDESQLTPILDACAARESSVEVVSMEGVAPLEVNRHLALAVCAALGVPEEIAERGMAAAGVDPGAFFIAELRQGGAGWRFVSAFACNDTHSFLDIWAEPRKSKNRREGKR